MPVFIIIYISLQINKNIHTLSSLECILKDKIIQKLGKASVVTLNCAIISQINGVRLKKMSQRRKMCLYTSCNF